jgi:transposase
MELSSLIGLHIYSLDFNPLEKIWSLLKNNLSKYLLESRIQNFFNNLPKKTIKNLTHSMRRKLEDSIKHKGSIDICFYAFQKIF